MLRSLCCLFLLFSLSCWSNTSELVAFFKANKNQDFEAAREITENLYDPVIKDHLRLLLELVSQKSVDPTILVEMRSEENNVLTFVKHLISGYQRHYAVKPNNLEAFKHFSEALKLSYELAQEEYTKAALMGILELFAAEIFIGSKQFEPYLDQFSALKSDGADEVLVLTYQLIFLSKAGEDVKNVDAQYYEFYNQLDSLFLGFPKEHALYHKYYFEKGIYHKIEGNFDKAEDFFLKADSLAFKKEHLLGTRSKIAWQLAAVHMLKGDLMNAHRYLSLSRQISGTLRDQFYNDRLASVIYQKEGKADSAYHYLRKSVDVEYALGYKNNTLESSILSVQNQTDKLKLDKLELESESRANRNFALALGLLLLFGSVITVLAYKNTKRKRLLADQAVRLEKQKMTNLLKEQELATIDAMVAGQEKERKRVANELHDDLGSLMAAVKLNFNALESATQPTNQEAFAKTESLIDEAYSKIRAIAHAKNSGLIAKQGLLVAVQEMAEKMAIANEISISVWDHGLYTRLENSMELSLFRVVQELLANIINHAAATEVNIHITNHGETLNILVEDNGRGFNAKEIGASAGMGLKSIDKRITALNGDLNIESEQGKGTVVIIDIPI